MSGHNKWSKIKRQKAATDSARSQVFSKLAQVITLESKKAGGDTSSPTLRALIEKARAANMPKDNIERAVAKGVDSTSAALESVLFETYGPGGVALLVDAVTDNNNRTSAEIRHILSKQGYSLAAPGSAAWAFEKTPDGYVAQSMVEIGEEDGEKLGVLIDSLEEHDDVQNVYTNAS